MKNDCKCNFLEYDQKYLDDVDSLVKNAFEYRNFFTGKNCLNPCNIFEV